MFPFADNDFPDSREHLRRSHYHHLQCPHGECLFHAGSKFEITRHQEKQHQSSQPLPPIQQTTNLDNSQIDLALRSRTLTWEEISLICNSMEYTRKVLKPINSEDGKGNGDDIEDSGNSHNLLDFVSGDVSNYNGP